MLVGMRTQEPLHAHRCPACGTVWQHGQSSFGDAGAHSCPACGAMQWHVDVGGRAPAMGLSVCPLSAVISSGLNLIVGDSGQAQAQILLQQQAAARRNIYIGGGALLAAALLVLVATQNR
jgi:hypothetical protein